MAPRLGPSAPSPRAPRHESGGNSDSARPPASLATLQSSSQNLKLFDQVSSGLPPEEQMEQGEEAHEPPSAWQQPSLFYYSGPLTVPPATPKTAGSSSVLPENTASFQHVERGQQEPKNPSGGVLFESNWTRLEGAVAIKDADSSVQASKNGSGDFKSLSFQQSISTPATVSSERGSNPFVKTELQEKTQQRVDMPVQERSPSPVCDDEGEISGSTGSAFAALASPLMLKMTQNRPPQDKVIAQHVLCGTFLRKYLHASNITRRLKETEQMLRSSQLNAGVAARSPQSGKFNLLLSKSSAKGAQLSKGTEGEGDDEPALIDKHAPVLRRMSSIDKAISNTVKRIRRLSGMADDVSEQQQQKPLSPTPAANLKAKHTSLRAISENQPAKLDAKRVIAAEPDDDDDDEDGSSLEPGEVKMDATSAHMLRICQHVMAKRAIKCFLHQEMSVIHQIETSLRDDETMQKHRASTPSSGSRSTNQSSSGSIGGSTGGDGRLPIKSMNADIVEAESGYLKEGDQHMTVDELFFAALEAEKKKLWKRAILLTSACIVIDREFIQVVLLRARCCRRIGLWTQAVKDLGHALLLRPEEPRLFLLRAFLDAKMSDLENSLSDVNRALILHPKSTDALLLRADIFHRQNNIGSSLQDLTTVLNLDPSCWRAYYDRATIRIRAVEGDELALGYHWEHMKYEQSLASIIEDYINSLRKGCKMVEVVETVGDLTVRLMEFTGDTNVLRRVIQNLAHLIQILSIDHRASFYMGTKANLLERVGNAPLTTMERELLVAALHAQRGRLSVLFGDKANALTEFNHAVVSEYHYPVAHFYRGAFAALISKEDDSKANVLHLTRSIALDPTIAGAYTVRGALYLRDLKFSNALQDFKAAVTTDPTLYEVWLQIALIYLNHYHDCGECVKACTSALTNDSCLARALYLRGEAHTRQGNTTAALKDYGRLTIAQPDDRWAQLTRGRLLLQLKLARPALYSFILFVEQGSAGGEKRAHLLCGMAFKILSRFKKAVDEFQRAAHLNPTSENLVLLSESLHSMGDTENSLRVSEKVISADPGSFRGYVRRAQLLVSVGQFQQAMSEYDKALFLAPKETRVYYERGIVQMQLYLRRRVAFQLSFDKAGGGSGATSLHLKKKKKRSPFDPPLSAIDVGMVLGTDAMNDEATVCKMMKTFYAGSISDFCKCIRLEPLLADPYVDRAELYALGEDCDKAFHDSESALERNPKFVRAYVNLGVLRCQFAAFAAAVDDFDKAIKVGSKLPLVYFNRRALYHKLSLWKHFDSLSVNAQICMGTLNLLESRYEESILSFAKALAIEPNSAIAHINLGVAYRCVSDLDLARRGELALAEHNFKRAIEELPSRKECCLARGKIIAQQKRLQDAMVDFSPALFLGYEGKL